MAWVNLPFETIDKREDVNICEGCVFRKEQTIGFAPFEIIGTQGKPDILFVAEAPFKDEMKRQRPLIGKSGSFLRDVVEELGLENYALANIVCCHPTKGSPQAPPDYVQEYCIKHVKAFIKDVQPKLIILLGKIAYQNLLPKEYLNAQLRDANSVTKMQKKGPYESNGIKYACSFHPSYLTRNGGKGSPHYDIFKNRLKNLIGMTLKGTENEIPIEEGDSLDFQFCHISQLGTILEELKDIPEIGFDYEALSLQTWNTDNKPTGFSLAYRTGEKSGKAYYIVIDRPLNGYEKRLLLNFLKKKVPWTYNAKFEANLTWAQFGEDVRLNDSFTLCKIDGKPQSLKLNSQQYLGADLWEEDVFSIVEYFRMIFELMIKHQQKYPEIVDAFKYGNYKKAAELADEDTKALKAFTNAFENIEVLLQMIDETDLVAGLKAFPYPWGAVPYRLLGEYCCWDAYNTVKIKDKLWKSYSPYYRYYITQTWLAGVLEAYGINWNDEKAKELNHFYMSEATKCLIDLIELLDIDDEKIIEAKQIANDPSFKGTPNARLAKIKKLVFNPLSNKIEAQEPFWKAFRSEETEVMAMFQVLETELKQEAAIDDDLVLPLINKTDLNTSLVNIINAVQGNNDAKNAVTLIIAKLEDKMKFYMQRFASEVLEFHYRALTKYGEVNIDEPDTWTKPFKMLYLLKRFKKISKADSTYIWGTVGRGSVQLARLDDMTKPPVRLGGYYEVGGENYKLKENERWILDTGFFENGAETKRWRSAIHVIPSTSELREIYTPRTSTSIILHYDYAQFEVRTLAAMCQEDNLMEAFARGVDIHRFVASRVWKIPEDDVTPNQRRFAKNATFAILYGKGVDAFASDFMKGDLAAAKRLFFDFFAAFPKIQGYIDSMHHQVLATGKVHTIFGDPLFINIDRIGINAAKRVAQNYPIQSSASSMAGHGIWVLREKIIKAGLKAVPICFTHDSSDWDIEIEDLFTFLPMMKEVAVEKLRRDFSIPADIDWEVGVHQNFMMELEKKSDGSYHFSCPKNTFNDIIERLKLKFDVSYEIHEETEERDSLSDMFLTKGAFSRYMGETIISYEGNLKLAA